MSEEDIAGADVALAAKDYDKAFQLYSSALDQATGSKDHILAGRATAQIKLKKHIEALEDALGALELDSGNARALGVAAQAHFALGDYPSAKEAYEKLSVMEPHKRVHHQWVDMCRVRMGEELPRNKEQPTAASSTTHPHTTSTRPASYGIVQSTPAAEPASAKIDDAEYGKYWWSAGIPGSHAEVDESQQKQQYRHQWFQMADKVEIAVLAKGLRSEQVHVAMQPESISIEIPERDYALSLRLAGRIVPEKSKWTVLATKVEIVLCKAESGAWPDLERTEETLETTTYQPSTSGVPSTVYPYAGKKVDWDSLEREAAQHEKENEHLEGEEGVMKFFRELYAGGNEDFRRAMMKSYVESGGTELSTNWDEVSKKDFKSTRDQYSS